MNKKTESNKQIAPNLQKLPFTGYYKTLPNPRTESNPRTLLLSIIASVTGKSIHSVRKWALGTATPSPMEKSAIATILKSDVETLFPEA